MQKLEEYITKKDHEEISISMGNFLKAKLRSKMKKELTAEEKIILKADDIYEDSMDVTKILKKLTEYERLKFILLCEEQLTLFNLLDRPFLNVDESQSMSDSTESIKKSFFNQMYINEGNEANDRSFFFYDNKNIFFIINFFFILENSK